MVSVHDRSTFFRKDVEDIAPAELNFCRGIFLSGEDSNDLTKFRAILYYAKEVKNAYDERLDGRYVENVRDSFERFGIFLNDSIGQKMVGEPKMGNVSACC